MEKPIPILAACLAMVVFSTALIVRRPAGTLDAGLWPASAALRRGGDEAALAMQKFLRSPAGAAGAAGRSRRADGLVRLAQKFYAKGNVQGALELLEAALEADPKRVGVYAVMGIMCAENGRDREAEAYLTRFVRDSGIEDPFVLLHLGLVELHQRKYAAAASTLSRVLEQRPDWVRVHCAAAAAFARLGALERALYHLRLAADRMGPDVLPLLAQPEFDVLRESPEFKALVQGVLRQAAGPENTGNAGVPAPTEVQ